MPRRQHVLELSCTRSAWSRLSALFFFTFTGSIHDYYSKCTDSQLNKIDEDREGLRVRARVRVRVASARAAVCAHARITD